MKNINTKSTSKYEVLAPAGSYTCMVAAFNAGADAVYLGGNMFGARASANNFSEEELLNAIDYAHLRGKKIFLTVNTLLKNEQIKKQLYDYIKPLYIAGLDAVIVQDFGVMEYIKEVFPNIDIHASTQMTVTGVEFAKKLKDIGVSRIVPARELSLREIREISDATKLEIECFVHGALCYCYSGMCLLSSVIGGRSGNRGRCAQPCRLPYDVIFDEKDSKAVKSNQYPLSPADLCTLSIIPDILESGVYSLKIEGRMKKPEYVAIVTSMYRKYVDMYENVGRKGYKVANEDIDKLKDIYNRGGFTDGYYKRHNGEQIMSVVRPNHMGTKAAAIISFDKKRQEITAKALQDLHNDDVLEIFVPLGENILVNPIMVSKGTIFTSKLSNKAFLELNKTIGDLKNTTYIMRTRNNKLISGIENTYISNDLVGKIVIGGCVVVCKDSPIALDVLFEDIYIHTEGTVPQLAQNRPISSEDILKQIKKTGATDFIFNEEELTISVEDGLFINIKELNSLRRDALDKLKNQLISKYHNEYSNRLLECSSNQSADCHSEDKHDLCSDTNHPISSVYVSTMEQFDIAVKSKHDIIAFEMDICGCNADATVLWNELIDSAHMYNKEVFMCLPYIFRTHGKLYMQKYIDFFNSNKLDGYVFRNMEELCWFDTYRLDRKKAVIDNTIYGFNNKALDFIMKYNPYLITASYELNMRELNSISCNNLELCVYGYIPVMISAGCVKKTYGRCNSKEEITVLKDRLGNNFKCKSNCTFCYNVIYNSKPLKLTDVYDSLNSNFICKKYMFTTESASETKKVLDGQIGNDFTRGHFKRGVE